MNNSELLAWDADIQEWLDKKDFSAIAEYTKENTRTILLKWQESDFEGLEKNLSIGSTVLQFFKAGLETMSEQSALLDIGTLLGTVESFQRLLYERGQTNRDIARNENQVQHIKHLSEIITALETHGSMTHTEMSEYLGLKISTLTEAMKRILNTGFVHVISSGKYKLYSLTDAGIRYGRRIRTEKSTMSFDDLILLLQDKIDHIPDESSRQQISTQFESLIRKIGGMAVFRKERVTLLLRTGDFSSDSISLEVDSFLESSTNDGSSQKYISAKSIDTSENALKDRRRFYPSTSSTMNYADLISGRSVANYGP